nr:hypothetical protein [Enterovibrio paralichthyis]
MYSQSLVAQLVRWFLLLITVLVVVHHCTPLQQALSAYAVDGGCHQHNSGGHTAPSHTNPASHTIKVTP